MEKIILGIDPGIADTGYGIIKVEKNGLACLQYGSIKTRPQQSLPERLEVLNDELKKIILEFKPQVIAVEELFFCKNAKTAMIVGQARGIVLLAAKQNNLKIHEFTPLEVKQGVAAFGQAGKAQVQKMVKTILRLSEIPKPDDAADALAIAICASNKNF